MCCCCWEVLLLLASVGWPGAVAEQEVRVPLGGNLTLLCGYNVTRHRLHVKTWYRRDPGGLLPLARTDGWVAPSHEGRLSASDLQDSGQMQVVMADVRGADTGSYSCAVGMRVGVHVIRLLAIQVSRGSQPDRDSAGANKTADRLFVTPERVVSPWSTSAVWELLRWLLLGLMTSGTALMSLAMAFRQARSKVRDGSPQEQDDAAEDVF
ncbi:uncharacterized protein LOC114909870 isoform X2 [Scleropages formosus]|uniref:uncharacterized protein LOC114909870 isoform X2 n=1 Tax=Scleropages formosus TaxID=113540 RepID=UPI0010FAC189|nr:uncharacterized protein LOC114909870 isoform X2 [Scleropages formosus]